MSIVKGIHHIAMKCCNELEYSKTLYFYEKVLELKKVREWEKGTMLDTGSGIMEIFNNGEAPMKKGIVQHFAFATDDVDACAKKIKSEGYEVFVEPKDIVIPSNPEFHARVAFCYGPLGEEIELFQEKL